MATIDNPSYEAISSVAPHEIYKYIMVPWHIATFARIRPPRRGYDAANFFIDSSSNAGNRAIITFPPSDEDKDHISLRQRDLLQFQFNDIYGPEKSQEDIFDRVCRNVVLSSLEGYNTAILAYGQTGSGKTYTVTGGEHYHDRGIIPRVFTMLFEEFEKRPQVKYSCFVSFMEIYNENVYDLLDKSHVDRPIEEWNKVVLLEDEGGEMHFRNLGYYEAVSEEEALNFMFLGSMNRVTSDTPMNQASSRSHAVFCITIQARTSQSDLVTTSQLHIVDLAGSERVYKRDGTQRMRTEGKHINLSLHHLEQVILSLRMTQKSKSSATHIPYRNSMLTSVLRGALGGNCKSVFIATLNSEPEFLEESISTCRFMQRCAEVVVHLAVNQEVDAEKRIEILEKRQAKLEKEKKDMKIQLQNFGTENQKLREDNKQLNLALRNAMAEMERLKQVASLNICEARVWSDRDLRRCQEITEELMHDLEPTEVHAALSHIFGKERKEMRDTTKDRDHEKGDNVLYELSRLSNQHIMACLLMMRDRARASASDMQQHKMKERADSELLANSGQNHAIFGTQRGSSDRIYDESRTSSFEKRQLERSKSISGPSDSDCDTSYSEIISEEKDTSSQSAKTYIDSLRQHGVDLLVKEDQLRTENVVPDIGTEASRDRATQDVSNPSALIRHDFIAKEASRARLHILQKGSFFVKYGRYGKPHVRFVWCTQDLDFLQYRHVVADASKARISTRHISQVLPGRATKVFARASRQQTGATIQDELCFSLEYDQNRTLDLEVLDGASLQIKKKIRNDWTEALQYLINLKSQRRRSQYIDKALIETE